MLETSAVVFPAWEGTRSDALKLVAAARGATFTRVMTGGDPMKEILKALGLPEDATAETAVAKIKEMNAAGVTLPALNASIGRIAKLAGLTAETVDPDALETAIAERFNGTVVTREELDRVKADGLRRDVVAAIDKTMGEGRLTASMKPWAEEYGMANGLEKLNAFLAKQPKHVPVGLEAPAATTKTTPATAGKLTAEDRKVIALTGTSEEEFLKTRATETRASEEAAAAVAD